jgi:TPR repeat protein
MRQILHALAALLVATLAASSAAGQAPYGLPDLYELVDLGPVNPPACPCIASPFALPAYRPDPRFGFGAATPPALERTVPDPVLLSSSDAATFVAYRYRHGMGVKQNEQVAAYWYYESALRGHNVGMVAVGLMYAAGRVLPNDFEAAVWWWQRAQPTTPLASRLLGDAHVCGLGVESSYERAMLSYARAAEAGDPGGMMQLAEMHVSGCVPLDDKEAVTWYRRAADAGLPEAQIALSDLIRTGRGVEMPLPEEAYYWARLAERRLPQDAPLRRRAAAAASASARLLPPDVVTAAEQMVAAMLAAAETPVR